MTIILLIIALIILLCILAEKFSDKFGMPALILFMFIGMLFGSDGIFKIPFENFELAENVCVVALVFIMFYGSCIWCFHETGFVSHCIYGFTIFGGNSRNAFTGSCK